ncbi:hypothetical protein LOTGIDRAFT_166800 [Lottia gigantea]|uniref:KANL2-like probable zinc-finger domain-containing protein n=1 Tax=Lottia gigantea TaxID=225164 RepID=V3ZW13_LOTGI|nr:hypothetical protein LOTGIDRAFT_166800 [Lottia gigantea]ESO86800.1 hypothetical protein LOTGIDRAFT_166800 [Lottia gigantea]
MYLYCYMCGPPSTERSVREVKAESTNQCVIVPLVHMKCLKARISTTLTLTTNPCVPSALRYCNNHMQVLGMIPKKKRKEKKETGNNKINNKESKLSFADRVKTKFNSRKNDVDNSKNENITVNVEDPYDPYAFSDPVSEPPCMLSNSTCSSSSLPSPNTDSVRSVPQSPGQSSNRPPSNEGMSSIAKLYPELAEKLEKIKPKSVEPKVKSRMRNTHNMKFNKLQTKIAQNRIKDKLRKQETSQFLTEGINMLQTRSDLDLPLTLNNSNHQNPALPTSIPPFNGTGIPHRPVAPHRTIAPPQNLHPTHSLGYKTTVTPGLTVSDPLGIPPPPYPGVGPNQNYNIPSIAPPMVLPNSDNHLSVITAPSMSTLRTAPGPITCPTNFQLPPPPPYVSPKQPKKPPSPVLPVLCKKPQRLKCVLFEKEARQKLKTDSCVRYYSYHAKRKINNHIYINHGICSSDESSSDDEDSDMLPWQPNWFSASSDDDNNDDEEEEEDPSDIPIHIRATKLALLRARLRRQCHQCRSATRSNTTVKKTNNSEILALIQAAKEEPRASVRCLQEILRKPKKKIHRSKYRGLEKRRCGYKNNEEIQCINNVLPYTNHCIKHQQLFDYCTAKFADNTQCCVPIFDIKHELPLCHEHGAKADNYQKIQVAEVRKRPRKKSKPPALSRPPKKNKKKKKGRAVRPQKPIPPSSPTGDISMPDEEPVPEINITTDEEKASSSVSKPEERLSLPSTSSTDNTNNSSQKEEKMIDNNLQGVDLEETFRHVIDKNFGELPLEQASRLLEEQDFQEVFNKIPDEAFDIFSSKNDPTAEETEELERALAAASSDIHAAKETLEQLVKGEISIDDIGEELTSILAATLQQNLQQEQQQQSDLTLPSESATTLSRSSGYSELGHSGMDLNNVPTSINNVAYTRQVLPGHASTSSNLNSAIDNTGSNVTHSMTHLKYYSVQHTTPMSLATQNVNPAASRSYTVGSGIPVGYQANLPYSQTLNNLPPSQHMAQPVSRNVMSNPALRSQLSQLPQQPLHHQSVIGQQLSNVGNFQPSWTTTGASQPQNFQNTNGYPSQQQYVSNVTKYPVSAQSVPMTTDVSNMTKSDSLYSTLSHSGNVPNVNTPGTASSVQGFGHLVSSPYTTLHQTPFTSNTSS